MVIKQCLYLWGGTTTQRIKNMYIHITLSMRAKASFERGRSTWKGTKTLRPFFSASRRLRTKRSLIWDHFISRKEREASSGRTLAKGWCLDKPRSRQMLFSPDSGMEKWKDFTCNQNKSWYDHSSTLNESRIWGSFSLQLVITKASPKYIQKNVNKGCQTNKSHPIVYGTNRRHPSLKK